MGAHLNNSWRKYNAFSKRLNTLTCTILLLNVLRLKQRSTVFAVIFYLNDDNRCGDFNACIQNACLLRQIYKLYSIVIDGDKTYCVWLPWHSIKRIHSPLTQPEFDSNTSQIFRHKKIFHRFCRIKKNHHNHASIKVVKNQSYSSSGFFWCSNQRFLW